MVRRLYRFSVPSILGGCLAALITMLIEAAVQSFTIAETVAGGGFSLLTILIPAIVFSLLTRGIFRSWNWPAIVDEMRDERGATPRFAAWVLFLILASMTLMFTTFEIMKTLFFMTKIRQLILFLTPASVLGVLILLLIVSKPLLSLLEKGFKRYEAYRSTKQKRALITPSLVLTILFVVATSWAFIFWTFSITPKLGHIELNFLFYLAMLAVASLLFAWLWEHRIHGKSLRQVLTIGIVSTSLACMLFAVWTRYSSPYRMLEIWGNTKIAGWSIDALYNVQTLREDLSVEGITPEEIPGANHPNVVLITIDTVRADFLPMYGGRAKMPNLAKFANDAVVFDRAFSPGNVTRRSLPSIATGLSPYRVKGRVAGWALRIDPRHILIGERYRAGGYKTAGFFCCVSHFGRRHRLGLTRGIEESHFAKQGKKLAKKMSVWLQTNRNTVAPVFLWAHFFDPHDWKKNYETNSTAKTVKDRYTLGLEATDRYLGPLLQDIRQNLGPETIIIITSDHGEGLGDHGSPYHAGGVYNPEIHVPLLISVPGIKGVHIQQVIGLVDLLPTVFELSGFKPPGMPQMDGLSVAPTIQGKVADKLGAGEAYSVMMIDRSVEKEKFSLVSGRYKLMELSNKKLMLFDLESDPKEKTNILHVNANLTQSMKARLERRKKIDMISPF